jgi:predicted HTH domain antitoxin
MWVEANTVTITLDIPRAIEGALSKEWTDIPRKALEAVALEGYRQGALSVGQVGELLSIGFTESEEFLKSRGASLPYDAGELEEDLRSARLLARK